VHGHQYAIITQNDIVVPLENVKHDYI